MEAVGGAHSRRGPRDAPARLRAALHRAGDAASPDGGVLTVTAIAPSAALTAVVGADGLAATLEPAAGGEAVLASEVTLTGATSFQAVGTIAFSGAHRLRIGTVGSGYLEASADPGRRHGAVVWRVKGGEGQFAGARGLITSNFFVGADLAVTDHHLGVLFLP